MNLEKKFIDENINSLDRHDSGCETEEYDIEFEKKTEIDSFESKEDAFIHAVIQAEKKLMDDLLEKNKELMDTPIPVSLICNKIKFSNYSINYKNCRRKTTHVPAITAILDLYFLESNYTQKNNYLEILRILSSETKNPLWNQICWSATINKLIPAHRIAAYHADLRLINTLFSVIPQSNQKNFKIELIIAIWLALASERQIEIIGSVVLCLCDLIAPLVNLQDQAIFTQMGAAWLTRYRISFYPELVFDPTPVMEALIKNHAKFQNICKSIAGLVKQNTPLFFNLRSLEQSIKLKQVSKTPQPGEEKRIRLPADGNHQAERPFTLTNSNKKKTKRKKETDNLGPITSKRNRRHYRVNRF